jgi:hypothetical protein
MVLSTGEYSISNLDEESFRRQDQPSFHVFAEGMHSDARGQIYNLPPDACLSLPHEKQPSHLFIVLVVRGELAALVRGEALHLRPLSQLVILPGVPCTLSATSTVTLELISFMSVPPRPGS